LAPENKRGAQIQSGSNPRAFRIGTEKRPWDMPTSQSNSVLETWIHADFPLLILNKQIAAQIGTAENTVKVHRSRAMEKMQANSLADLIKMIERPQVPRGNSP
jgi:Bacterial regulatory proteins, luxR family